MPCGRRGGRRRGSGLLFTDADVLFKPDSLRRAVGYAEAERAGPRGTFPAHGDEELGRENDDRFFQVLLFLDTGRGRLPIPRRGPHGVGAFQYGPAVSL